MNLKDVLNEEFEDEDLLEEDLTAENITEDDLKELEGFITQEELEELEELCAEKPQKKKARNNRYRELDLDDIMRLDCEKDYDEMEDISGTYISKDGLIRGSRI